jgi:aspartate dehydrogenase
LNVNVAATLACAGSGLDQTRARVFADPTISRNNHQIFLSGRSGVPSPENPRTSALTEYSVIKAVRSLSSNVVFL